MRDHWITPFLTALRATGVVASAARAAGVSSATVYKLRQKDADFAAEFENALEDSYDALESEARRRALEGVEEPVVYQGQLTPVWERDANGEIVMQEYDTGIEKDGQPVMATRPVQARNADGSLQWLTVRKKSDALMAFLLKGYRKRFATDVSEVTGANGGPLQVDSTQRAARVQALLEVARQRKQGADDVSDLA